MVPLGSGTLVFYNKQCRRRRFALSGRQVTQRGPLAGFGAHWLILPLSGFPPHPRARGARLSHFRFCRPRETRCATQVRMTVSAIVFFGPNGVASEAGNWAESADGSPSDHPSYRGRGVSLAVASDVALRLQLSGNVAQ